MGGITKLTAVASSATHCVVADLGDKATRADGTIPTSTVGRTDLGASKRSSTDLGAATTTKACSIATVVNIADLGMRCATDLGGITKLTAVASSATLCVVADLGDKATRADGTSPAPTTGRTYLGAPNRSGTDLGATTTVDDGTRRPP